MMGEWLAGLDAVPDVILCSTAERARQTVENLLQTLPFEGEVVYSRVLYHAGDEVFTEELGGLGDEIGMAMIVGHNPGMEYAIESYTGEWQRMPTAAVARIEFPISKWGQLEDLPEGKLAGLWLPREVS
jgi:phosphohistidine phosphatase